MPDIGSGNASETRLLTDERFLRKIAYLYYDDGQSQESIAETMFCSRQVIGKGLQRARERGIVRVSIVPDQKSGYLHNLSREVRLQLELDDLVLVPGSSMSVIAPGEILQDVVNEIATAAADYLDQLLTDTDILAVAGGRTFMRNLVRYIKPRRVLSHLQVVATIGFVEARTKYGDANLIAHDLAEAYGASHLWFPAPAILLDAAQVEQVRSLPIVKESYDMMLRANVVVMSVFPPYVSEDPAIHQLSQKQHKAIEAHQPAADINHWMFDAEGRCINELLTPPPYFLSGLEIPRLKDRLKQKGTNVILVVGGSPAYIPAIRAILRAGVANILVTDHVTAQLLLREV